MISDLYIRTPEDPNYKFLLSHSDQIESIVTKIKMILNTSQGKVLGDVNFGVGLEDLVFETKINKTELENRIKQQISQYVSESRDFRIDSKVSFGKADGYDYALVDIYVDDVKTTGILVS
jgi:phage baseplate assembly protein W